MSEEDAKWKEIEDAITDLRNMAEEVRSRLNVLEQEHGRHVSELVRPLLLTEEGRKLFEEAERALGEAHK